MVSGRTEAAIVVPVAMSVFLLSGDVFVDVPGKIHLHRKERDYGYRETIPPALLVLTE